MEPLSAVSFAGTIVEFTQFALKITSLARAIGAARQADLLICSDLDERVRRLRELHTELESGRDNLQGKVAEEHRTLKDVCIDCCQHAQQLESFVTGLQRSASGKYAPKALAAFKLVWHEGKIRDLQAQLQQKQNEMHLYMTSYQGTLGRERLDTLNKASSSIVDEVRADQEMTKLVLGKVTELITRFDAQRKLEKTKQTAFMSQLRFSGMRSRYFAIKDAYTGSARWIYADPGSGQDSLFKEWLMKDDGVFWITGKPGSGKSTIMKLVSEHDRTREALRKWNDGKCPTIANYFFSVGDNDLARSQVGLAKALLHDVLARNSHIVEDIINLFASSPDINIGHVGQHFAERFQSMDELFTILRYVTHHSDLKSKCCFFIDGLDESDTPPRELCDFICELGSYHDIKICASSRLWIEFQDAFEAMSCKVLRVHEHTRDDMRLYVHGLLKQDRVFEILAKRDERYYEAVSKLVDRAQGVFLWIFLVVRSLRNSLNSALTFSDFQLKLDEFPDDLHEFFLRMLDLPPLHYKQRAAQLCLMVLNSIYPLRIIQVTSIFVEDAELSCHQAGDTEVNKLDSSCKTTYARMKAHCTDLIEIYRDPIRAQYGFFNDGTRRSKPSPGTEFHGHRRIEFVHRTVRDFFKIPDIHGKVVRQAGEGFDVGLALCAAQYHHLKELPLKWFIHGNFWLPQKHRIDKTNESIEHIVSEQLLPSLIFQAGMTSAENHWQAEQVLDKAEKLLRTEFEVYRQDVLADQLLATIRRNSFYFEYDIQLLCESAGPVLISALYAELDWYVLQRIRSGSMYVFAETSDCTKCLTDLLRMAFEMLDVRYLTRIETSPKHNGHKRWKSMQSVVPSLVVVMESLLHEGATPNAGAHTEKSVWHFILGRLAKVLKIGSPSSSDLDAAQTSCIARVIHILLLNGAQPDTVVYTTDGHAFIPTSVEDISKSPPLSKNRDSLLQNLRQSRRRWERTQRSKSFTRKRVCN